MEPVLPKNIVGVDGGAFPPVLRGGQLEHRKVQMRGVFGGVAGGADIADDLPFF